MQLLLNKLLILVAVSLALAPKEAVSASGELELVSLGPSVTVLANLEHRVLRKKDGTRAHELAEIYMLLNRCRELRKLAIDAEKKVTQLASLCDEKLESKVDPEDRSELAQYLAFRSHANPGPKEFSVVSHMPEARYVYMKRLGDLRTRGRSTAPQNMFYEELVKEFLETSW
ncbi:MAG TPA: hypothetical protein PLH57_09915 [Oligoflexia bacterium]|nr:hypothetical protein [Oligoflexia bacterium]